MGVCVTKEYLGNNSSPGEATIIDTTMVPHHITPTLENKSSPGQATIIDTTKENSDDDLITVLIFCLAIFALASALIVIS